MAYKMTQYGGNLLKKTLILFTGLTWDRCADFLEQIVYEGMHWMILVVLTNSYMLDGSRGYISVYSEKAKQTTTKSFAHQGTF